MTDPKRPLIDFWGGLWLFMSIYAICELVLALHGVSGFFWQFKGPGEADAQRVLARGCDHA